MHTQHQTDNPTWSVTNTKHLFNINFIIWLLLKAALSMRSPRIIEQHYLETPRRLLRLSDVTLCLTCSKSSFPPNFPHSSSKSFSRISAPLFRANPVSSRLSSHIFTSSTPKNKTELHQITYSKYQVTVNNFLLIAIAFILYFTHQHNSPATSRTGCLSGCTSIWRAIHLPSKWAYHHPRLLRSSGRTNGILKKRWARSLLLSTLALLTEAALTAI